MSVGNIQVRRATVDDLPKVHRFFEAQKLPAATLEKRLTDFQAAFNEQEEVVAVAGLHLEKQQGRIHTIQTIAGEKEAELQKILWDRIQSVARNHGLYRLWMEPPLWPGQSLPAATVKELERLPPTFGDKNKPWHVLQLKEELEQALSLDREFELFTLSQKEDAEKVMRQAKALKTLAYVIAALFVAVAGFLIFEAFRRQAFSRKPKP
jgi:hypothetical protein